MTVVPASQVTSVFSSRPASEGSEEKAMYFSMNREIQIVSIFLPLLQRSSWRHHVTNTTTLDARKIEL